ncbi:tetratricopeptide repeat protein [Pseudoluteimonas lycopersici]|uniref:Tetratricopeptide repeat protein n=1 Tax=Pseudoluteimonas lycopersici TaxID=1324796 RepID=A0A516V6C0_9GAMM|nr:tetratricopeptide repeat protein [Lysobacter lycopersici]QDQ74058.1 tetratricopeptide repeat protein [Lysobacter lycopersici]
MSPMPRTMTANKNFAKALLMAFILLAVVPAATQARDRKDNGSEQSTEQKYPQATRKPPEQKVDSDLQAKIEKLFKAYQNKDAATVVQLADEVISNQKAGAYEHALAARIAGVTLLNNDNDKAKAYLEQAVAFDGLSNNEHYESMNLLSQMDLIDKQYDKSLALIDRFLAETKAQDPDSFVIKGNDLYRLKRYPEAIAALKTAIDASPEPKPEWLNLLMAAYFDAGQPQEATKIAEELIAKHPDDKALQLNLAASYMQAGQDDKAAALLEKLRTSGGLTQPEDYRNLYAMYLNHDKNKEGIAVIQEGLQKGVLKEDFETMNSLAQAYWFSGQSDQAIAAYRKAAPLAPDGETYLNLARALLNEGQMAAARQAAQQALDKGVHNPGDAKKILATGK